MLIRTNKEKIDVDIKVKNSRDNAYNTKVILSFTPNIQYMKVEVGFLLRPHRIAALQVDSDLCGHVFCFVLSAREGLHSESH